MLSFQVLGIIWLVNVNLPFLSNSKIPLNTVQPHPTYLGKQKVSIFLYNAVLLLVLKELPFRGKINELQLAITIDVQAK